MPGCVHIDCCAAHIPGAGLGDEQLLVRVPDFPVHLPLHLLEPPVGQPGPRPRGPADHDLRRRRLDLRPPHIPDSQRPAAVAVVVAAAAAAAAAATAASATAAAAAA